MKRLAFRNEMSLYHRKCDKSGKQMISMYSPENPLVIYDQKIWWSDDWDAMEYGRDYDFTKPFFEQYKELQKVVPRMSLNNIQPENSDYANLALGNKNCYLVFTADYNEDSAYLRFAVKNFKCFDGDFVDNSIECYECVEIDNCNRCSFTEKAKNCSDLIFCYNMTGCDACIGCANLIRKKNCIFNEQLTDEEFGKRKKELALNTHSGLKKFEKEYQRFFEKRPRKYLDVLNCENCLGDHLSDSKNAYLCYDSKRLEDCRYIINCWDAKSCYDWDFVGAKGSIDCHEMVSSAYNMVNCHFCAGCWENNNEIYYCELCLGSANLFGCIGLRHKKYCILNKQYSREEYEKLLPKILKHMQSTGEWGEFFPAQLAPFAYNETVAEEYFPIGKEKAIERGFRWYEDESEKMYKGTKYEIPDSAEGVDKEICKQILTCEVSGKPYKILPQKLDFLTKMKLPLPRISSVERHKIRMNKRNIFAIYSRNCSKCGVDMFTSYSPDRPEPIYCEKCYLEAFA